jgi:hypothetical protein
VQSYYALIALDLATRRTAEADHDRLVAAIRAGAPRRPRFAALRALLHVDTDSEARTPCPDTAHPASA